MNKEKSFYEEFYEKNYSKMEKVSAMLDDIAGQHINLLPILPRNLVKLIDLLALPDVAVDKIASAILSDPSLTAKIFKIVNSSLYSLSREINNMTDAIVILGLNPIKNIVYGISVIESCKMYAELSKLNFINYWQHSISTGVIARLLSDKMQLPYGEENFIIGILHDLGKLILTSLYMQLKDKRAMKLSDGGEVLLIAGKKIKHYEITIYLFQKWNLPEYIYKIIYYVNLSDQDFKRSILNKDLTKKEISQIRILKAANQLGIDFSVSFDEENLGLKENVVDSLDLETDSIKKIVLEAPDLIYRFFGYVNMDDIPTEKEIYDSLEKANRQLNLLNIKYENLNQKLSNQVETLNRIQNISDILIKHYESAENMIEDFLKAFYDNFKLVKLKICLSSSSENKLTIYNLKNMKFNTNTIDLTPIQRDDNMFRQVLISDEFVLFDQFLLKKEMDEFEQIVAEDLQKFQWYCFSLGQTKKIGFVILDTSKMAGSSELNTDLFKLIFKNLYSAIQREKSFSEITILNKELKEKNESLSRTRNTVLKRERQAIVGKLAAGIAHEVNNMLAPITGRAQILKMFITEEKLINNISIIEDSAFKVADLIQSLLIFARQEYSSMTKVSVNDVVKNTMSLLEYSFRKKEVKPELNIEENIPFLMGNRAQLTQLMLNILNNSLEAMENKDTISITTSSGDEFIMLEIKDGGSGMDDEILEKCIDPFYSTKNSAGMGLSVVDGIVDSHNATWEIYSTVGEGTEIKIFFPIAKQ